MSLRRRDLAGAILALAVAALFVRLGVWQLNRLADRKARNAEIEAAHELAPVELPLHRVEPEALRDRRAHARGVYDYTHERVWRGRTYDGAPGVALLTPLRLSDGSAVFVDRGWVPSPDAAHVDATRYREGDSADVTGLALPAPRDRGDVDPPALKDSLPYTVLRIVIQLNDSTARHPSGLKRWRPPALDNGPHLSYAIQWFCFAGIVIIGVAVLLWRTSRASSKTVE
ncbi:MAG TPA: SURF1 family protein [Gemmatimonadales bacterium]|nr:SURF1 family protein [Gemmatimonadales bacterium]